MNIKPEILNKWKAAYVHGDYMRIADDYISINQRISQQRARKLVQDAFKFGICRDNLYPVIEKYFQKIEKKLKAQ